MCSACCSLRRRGLALGPERSRHARSIPGTSGPQEEAPGDEEPASVAAWGDGREQGGAPSRGEPKSHRDLHQAPCGARARTLRRAAAETLRVALGRLDDWRN
jgi:hypothetical protein